MKANGEIISTLISSRDETVFVRSQDMQQPAPIQFCRRPTSSCRAADTFHLRVSNETIIAGASKYSVSHFIDCEPVARTLGASLIASRNAADHTGKNKGMNKLQPPTRLRIRKLGATLFGVAVGLALAA